MVRIYETRDVYELEELDMHLEAKSGTILLVELKILDRILCYNEKLKNYFYENKITDKDNDLITKLKETEWNF